MRKKYLSKCTSLIKCIHKNIYLLINSTFCLLAHTHAHTRITLIYIYIYICLCVCQKNTRYKSNYMKKCTKMKQHKKITLVIELFVNVKRLGSLNLHQGHKRFFFVKWKE